MGLPVFKVGNNGAMEVRSEWTVARITEVDSSATGTGDCAAVKHGWIEQKVCKNGTAYEDAPTDSAEGGSIAGGGWAFPIGGGVAAVDDIVLLRYKGMDSNALPVYEFVAATASASSSSVNARVKIATPDGDGKIGIIQNFTGSGLTRTFSDGDRVYVHEVNGYTAYLPIGSIFLAQELASGIYGVQLDPTAVTSVTCDEVDGLIVTTRS